MRQDGGQRSTICIGFGNQMNGRNDRVQCIDQISPRYARDLTGEGSQHRKANSRQDYVSGKQAPGLFPTPSLIASALARQSSNLRLVSSFPNTNMSCAQFGADCRSQSIQSAPKLPPMAIGPRTKATDLHTRQCVSHRSHHKPRIRFPFLRLPIFPQHGIRRRRLRSDLGQYGV